MLRPTVNHSSSYVSLRDEARLRASGSGEVRSGPSYEQPTTTAFRTPGMPRYDEFSERPFVGSAASSSPASDVDRTPWMRQPSRSWNTAASAQSQPPPQKAHRELQQYDSHEEPDDAASDIVDRARNDWRRTHGGMGLSQAWSEQNSPVAGPPQPATAVEDGSDDHSGIYVHVVGAEPRLDPAGVKFTAYLIRITVVWPILLGEHNPTPENTDALFLQRSSDEEEEEYMLERRYSEFWKLHRLLEESMDNNQSITTISSSEEGWVKDTDSGIIPMSPKVQAFLEKKVPPFPARSWAGRLGHWSPAQIWAPQQYHSLIAYRQEQLHLWLVPVVRYYRQWPIHVQTALDHFLSLGRSRLPNSFSFGGMINDVSSTSGNSTQSLPPCQQENYFTTDDSFWKWHNPVSFTLGSAIRQAARTLDIMCPLTPPSHNEHINPCSDDPHEMFRRGVAAMNIPSTDRAIPLDLLQAAQGLLFLTMAQAGMVVSGRVGTGLLIRRMTEHDVHGSSHDGVSPVVARRCWSAPVALGIVGMGWGALMGADVTHSLVILTTQRAVLDLVASETAVQLGAQLSAAVGPLGRAAHSHLQAGSSNLTNAHHHPSHARWNPENHHHHLEEEAALLHPAYAYAHSQGLFVGVSLEGSVLKVRSAVNAKFYGRTIDKPVRLLYERGPRAAEPLYERLDKILARPLHPFAFRPSRLWESNNLPQNPPPRNHPINQRQVPQSFLSPFHSGASMNSSSQNSRSVFPHR